MPAKMPTFDMLKIGDTMTDFEPIGFEARLVWELLFGNTCTDELQEPAVPYGNPERLDLLSARELLDLMYRVQDILEEKGYSPAPYDVCPSVTAPIPDAFSIRVSKDYRIFILGPNPRELALRPLLRTVFILFLRHPEGILLKEREAYKNELLEIYACIVPNLDEDIRRQRIERLASPDENTFSESLSHLNRKLDTLLDAYAPNVQVYGSNGNPRRINLNPMYVHWEERS